MTRPAAVDALFAGHTLPKSKAALDEVREYIRGLERDAGGAEAQLYASRWDADDAHPFVRFKPSQENKWRHDDICPLCGKVIRPRGRKQHLAWHERRGDITTKTVEFVGRARYYDLCDGTYFPC